MEETACYFCDVEYNTVHESPMILDIEIEDPPLNISWGPIPDEEWSMLCATFELVDFGDDLVGYKLLVSFPVIAVPNANRSTGESTL